MHWNKVYSGVWFTNPKRQSTDLNGFCKTNILRNMVVFQQMWQMVVPVLKDRNQVKMYKMKHATDTCVICDVSRDITTSTIQRREIPRRKLDRTTHLQVRGKQMSLKEAKQGQTINEIQTCKSVLQGSHGLNVRTMSTSNLRHIKG